jgi:hypothetical protein
MVSHALDCKPSDWQVQAENMQQAEALVRISKKLETLDTDIQDTQQLISALHGPRFRLFSLF